LSFLHTDQQLYYKSALSEIELLMTEMDEKLSKLTPMFLRKQQEKINFFPLKKKLFLKLQIATI
jgi:hypothetical protein